MYSKIANLIDADDLRQATANIVLLTAILHVICEVIKLRKVILAKRGVLNA